MPTPKRVDQRIRSATTRIAKILERSKARDVNEADTVIIVTKILEDVFGWDPIFEVTAEYAIRSTFVDLAVKADDSIAFLIEVKAIGASLRETHLRQAIGYAASAGVEWVVLTNGIEWQAHRVSFGKPVTNELVFTLDFINANPRDAEFRDTVFVLTKEGMTQSALQQFHAEKQAMSRFNIAAILRSDGALRLVRRELRRAYPDMSPDLDQIGRAIESDVLKRDVVQGEHAAEAVARMRRASSRQLRASKQTPQ